LNIAAKGLAGLRMDCGGLAMRMLSDVSWERQASRNVYIHQMVGNQKKRTLLKMNHSASLLQC
jgi:hypothetical protein